MAKTAKGKTTTNLRYESEEVHKMVDDMAKHFMNSHNGMINFCIKEYYTKIFKKP